ncbi:serine protease inhibitor I/II-like [Schistocerca cancellata]|uniref:serine protease inhibitor I/II-like n=1 Tax=Schistocerca cancellata TaxID=274614 RepID=UPI0021175AB7|nr:serine protease inhibitor I/II-like [Schistocerca cancellata]
MKGATYLWAALLLFVSVQANRECTAGETKRESCKVCTCSATGVWVCPDKYCVPGTTYMDDCNTCRCGDDGISAACTLKGCGGN